MFSVEKTSRRGVRKESIQLYISVSVADAQAAKLPKSGKSLQTACAVVASWKEQLAHVNTKNADSDKLLAQILEE